MYRLYPQQSHNNKLTYEVLFFKAKKTLKKTK